MIRAIALCAAVSLAGCGQSVRDGTLGGALFSVGKQAASAVSGEGGKTAARPALTQEALAQVPGALMLMELKYGTGLAQAAAVNRGQVTWASEMGFNFTLQSGFLTATRGLSDDLMGVTVQGFGPALQGKNGGRYTRIMEWLDGLDQPKQMQFTCQITESARETLVVAGAKYPARKFTDQCSSQSLSFVNHYWVGTDSKVRKTRQWISVGAGYLTSTLLKSQ